MGGDSVIKLEVYDVCWECGGGTVSRGTGSCAVCCAWQPQDDFVLWLTPPLSPHAASLHYTQSDPILGPECCVDSPAMFPAAPNVRSGATMNSLLVAVYRFWRSQAPMEKPAAPVNDRMLPAVVQAAGEKASVGT